jgi:hypothetical protein
MMYGCRKELGCLQLKKRGLPRHCNDEHLRGFQSPTSPRGNWPHQGSLCECSVMLPSTPSAAFRRSGSKKTAKDPPLPRLITEVFMQSHGPSESFTLLLFGST